MTNAPTPTLTRPKRYEPASRLLGRLVQCLDDMDNGREPLDEDLYHASAKLARALMPLAARSVDGKVLVDSHPVLLDMAGPAEPLMAPEALLAILQGRPS